MCSPPIFRTVADGMRGEKISIKLQHRLQEIYYYVSRAFFFSSLVLFLLFPPPALLPGRDDMTTAAAAVDAAAAATCVVNILHGSLRWLFLLFSQPKRKILNGRRTTSYWLTIDTSDFSEMKGEMLGLKYVFLSIICHRRKSKRTLIFELNVQVSISTIFPLKKRLRV